MAQQSVPLGTWDEDPDGASILLAGGARGVDAGQEGQAHAG